MREKDARGEADPSWDCKLAEALLVAGRHADAAECASRAFPSLGNDTPMLRICAWGKHATNPAPVLAAWC
jgi:hypothetical protein